MDGTSEAQAPSPNPTSRGQAQPSSHDAGAISPASTPWASITNETFAENQPETARMLRKPDKQCRSAWEDGMGTFLFLALSSAFLLGMVAGALARRIVD